MAERISAVIMKQYLDIVKKVIEQGQTSATRQGINVKKIAGAMFEHDMQAGFPLLTTKKVPFRLVAAELEFFIKGITDKQWLLDRNDHIWDEWANPQKAPYGHEPAAKDKMLKYKKIHSEKKELRKKVEAGDV